MKIFFQRKVAIAVVLFRLLITINFGIATHSTSPDRNRADEENPAVTRLRNFLRFRTEHPKPDVGYAESITWLRSQAEEIGLNFTVYDMEAPNLFAIVLTWEGRNPGLNSILLNSHLDVVTADPSKWTYPPYIAHKDTQGRIYARGASDMKAQTVAELEAIRRLKLGGFQPLRTIHLTVIPDEELGGFRGMKAFVKTDFFKKLNVGIDIDEGGALDNATSTLWISVAEKSPWKFNITARGALDHGSSFPQYTSPQRLQLVIDRLMEYRQTEYLKYIKYNHSTENVTTINLVGLGGGVADNVIPSQVWASFDMRIAVEPDWTFEDVDEMLNKILKEASLGSQYYNERVTIDFMVKSMETGRTTADDSNPWWVSLQQVCREINITCKPRRIPQATDGRYLRELGIPVFGLCPFVSFSAHHDNEFVAEGEFLRAIDIYQKIINNFASVLEQEIQ